MWRNSCAALIISASFLVGCNKESDDTAGVPVADKPSLPEGATARPTTQELADRVKLDLKYDPISIMAPSSWELKSMGDGSMIVVEGYTPHDKVSISLPIVRVITDNRNLPAKVQIKSLETQAIADAATHPDLIKGDVVHDVGGAHLIEDFTVDAPVPAGTADASAGPVQPMNWVVQVCVPSGTDMKIYELRFRGLTVKTYQQDSDFLHSIINSVTYTPPPPDSLIK